LNVLASVAEWEREAIGERTRDALQHLKAEGVRLGGAALGWTRTEERNNEGRHLWAEVEAEAMTVRRILELHAQGQTLRGIARTLVTEGFRTKRGGVWSHKQVAKVLTRSSGTAA
jgi:DNA invertase Pin-like site-specific DNA recombinase